MISPWNPLERLVFGGVREDVKGGGADRTERAFYFINAFLYVNYEKYIALIQEIKKNIILSYCRGTTL
jgi:hypothetical protein